MSKIRNINTVYTLIIRINLFIAVSAVSVSSFPYRHPCRLFLLCAAWAGVFG